MDEEPAAQPAAEPSLERILQPPLRPQLVHELDDAQRIGVRHLGALLAPVENRVRRGGDLILVTGQLRRHIVMLRHGMVGAVHVDRFDVVDVAAHHVPLSPQMQPARSEQASIDDVDTAITPLA